MKLPHILALLSLVSHAAAAATPETQAIEFYNPALQHYFITADAAEALGIDNGNAGPSWTRTGRGFGVWLNPAYAPAGSAGVCRFYSAGANSHFFTAGADECAGLKALEIAQREQAIQLGRAFAGWTFEGTAFTAAVPTGSQSSRACESGSEEIHRAYNNGFASGLGANHRFVNDDALRTLMEDRGWTSEGVAFCGPVQGSGTSAPAAPAAGSFPELAAAWSGSSRWEFEPRPNGAKTEVDAAFNATISESGALTGSGNGCALAGTIAQVDGFRALYTGTIGVNACADARFNGTWPLRIERLRSGQLQLHFGKETAASEVEVEAFLSAAIPPVITPPPPPPNNPMPSGFVLAGTWGANDVNWTARVRQGNSPEQTVTGTHALSLTISSSNGVTGSGFGCTFTGTIQQPSASVRAFVASLQGSGCSDSKFNGTYPAAALHEENGALQLEIEREIEGGGVRTKVRIEGVLRK